MTPRDFTVEAGETDAKRMFYQLVALYDDLLG